MKRGAVGVNWKQTATLSDADIGNDNLLIEGNVGIGTTNPQAKLDIQGNLRVGQYTLPSVDGQAGQVLSTDGNGSLSWVDMGGGGFGDWVDVTVGAGTNNNIAATDGIIVAKRKAVTTMRGWTAADNSNFDNTNISNFDMKRCLGSSPGDNFSLSMPVKKGHYWKISQATQVYWIPLGS